MDVPIAPAVILATTMSLVQTIVNARHVYFDASVTLLFFLLIGRYLDAGLRKGMFGGREPAWAPRHRRDPARARRCAGRRREKLKSAW